jgi:hypothetical protein
VPDALRVDRATPAHYGPASLYIPANARHQLGLATQPAFPGAVTGRPARLVVEADPCRHADIPSIKDNSASIGFFSATGKHLMSRGHECSHEEAAATRDPRRGFPFMTTHLLGTGNIQGLSRPIDALRRQLLRSPPPSAPPREAAWLGVVRPELRTASPA